jgi:hypothetical protein
MKRAFAGVIGLGLVAMMGAVSADVASAAPKALNKVYPHGVGRTSASRDKTKGVRVRNFKVSKTVYSLNTRLDRDKDKIACEKR